MTARKKPAKGVDAPTIVIRLEGEHITVGWDWSAKKMDDDEINSLGFLFYVLNTGRLHETIADALMNRAEGEGETYIAQSIFRAANEYFEKERLQLEAEGADEVLEDSEERGDAPIVPPSQAFSPLSQGDGDEE